MEENYCYVDLLNTTDQFSSLFLGECPQTQAFDQDTLQTGIQLQTRIRWQQSCSSFSPWTACYSRVTNCCLSLIKTEPTVFLHYSPFQHRPERTLFNPPKFYISIVIDFSFKWQKSDKSEEFANVNFSFFVFVRVSGLTIVSARSVIPKDRTRSIATVHQNMRTSVK